MSINFLTNSRSRTLTIGKKSVEFRHVSPKKLILAGTQAGIALIALWYLGKEEITIETMSKIKESIENELPTNSIVDLDRIEILYTTVSGYIDNARTSIQRSIDTEMVKAFWLMGRDIVLRNNMAKKERNMDKPYYKVSQLN